MSEFDETKIRKLDFTLLLVLRALLRHRQATVAAAEVNLSPSAISHALRRLRQLLGEPLFLRRPHGLEPTRRAIELAPLVDAILADARTLLGLPDAFDAETTERRFVLAGPDHVVSLVAAPLFRAFQRCAPRARFALRTAVGADALDLLRRNEVDLVLGQFQGLEEEFAIERLYTDDYRVVARAGHPGIRRRVTRAIFERLGHVVVSPGGDFRSITDDDLRRSGITRRVVVAVPRFPTAFEIVATTDAVALAPGRLAMAHARAFGLTVYPAPVKVRPVHVLLVAPRYPDAGRTWLAGQISAALAVR